VEAAFDAGLVTSDAGALLLKATDEAIGLMGRFAGCFHDERRPELIEHEVATLVGQRVFAIALGRRRRRNPPDRLFVPLTRRLAALGATLSRKGRGFWSAGQRHSEPSPLAGEGGRVKRGRMRGARG
jgi:hypothetical protein